MTIFDVAARLKGVRWAGPSAFTCRCPVEGHEHQTTSRVVASGAIILECPEGGDVWKTIGLDHPNRPADRPKPPPEPGLNGTGTGTKSAALAILERQFAEKDDERYWQEQVADKALQIHRANPQFDRDAIFEALAVRAPRHLSQEEIAGGAIAIIDQVIKEFPAKNLPAKVAIPWESYHLAVEANEAYLARQPVIDKLCYSSAVSMITGGKHAGKSTLARWMAICVAKGLEFLKRPVIQGPVFYIASEDEAMPARQELIRLGWDINDPLRFFSSANMPTDDPIKFLLALTEDIKIHRVALVILDMLFDFVRIADEMSYAGTREAVGHIQDVASQTGAHLTVIHHAPKNAQIGDAAVAALGSQGLAARVSPIILVRRFGPGVHSIVSTTIRDPRGEAIGESRLLRHEDGSVTLGGIWKTYMLAEAYSERVLEFICQEEGAEVTASDVADGLSIAYEVARACLSSLWKGGAIERTGAGKKGKPFRYTVKDKNTPHSVSNRGVEPTAEEQGRFGYKD